MNISCKKEALSESISIVSKAVASRAVLNILEGIYIKAEENGKITLIGNDLEIGIESVIEGKVIEGGEIVLNAKMFFNIVRSMSDSEISIETRENGITTIKSGNSKFEIVGINASEFPFLPSVEAENSIRISKVKLKEMIEKTSFAAAQTDTRPVLCGCLLETLESGLRMVALDGFRMAIRDVETDVHGLNFSVIIPAKSLNELSRILNDDGDVNFCFSPRYAMFEFENNKMVIRLIEGEYLNYRGIISDDFETEIVCNVNEIIAAVNRASLIIVNEFNRSPIKFKVEDGVLRISCETTAGTVNENIETERGLNPVTIGFSNKYLLSALHACGGEEIIFKIKAANKPAVIVPTDGDSYLHLILPMQI